MNMGASINASPAKKQQPEPDINVTPLVDVCLVLLIIFMVIAPQMENGERVELPAIVKPDKKQKSKVDPITVTIGRTGKLFIEKEPIELEGLEQRLKDAHDVDPDRRVVLKGDSLTDYQKTRDVFATVQKAGFGGVALVVSKRGNASDDDGEDEGG
jgi:biopolymer transport protein ExbD/biopolymer transport protein TolR